ncbi:MAG: hypothetical protein H7Z42_07185 [Roseiflexaceae bacterium]|nr:hypothetical protein [Roseiflexaceae bacterium]
MSIMRRSLISRLPTVLACLLVLSSSLAAFPATTLAAPTVVTNCTEAGLIAALAVGGDITFNCGGPATITVTNQKVISKNTSIDGSNNGNQVTISGANNVRVLFVSVGATLTLNNIKIANGNASGASPSSGGGLYNAGTIVLTYVFFDSNQAVEGGGIFNAFGATATLNQVYFGFNKASYGGGGLFNNGTLLGISSGGYNNNTTDNYGAGIFFNGGTTTISYASFEGNISGGNGGAIYANNGALTISNSTSFTNNQAKRQGGAIWDGLASPNVLRIDNATFTGNSVTGANSASSYGDDAEGGAIYTYRNDAINISNSTFTTNSAKGGNGNGNYGGDATGGAIYHHGTGLMTIATSTFSQNTTTGGNGGMNGGGDATGGAIAADYGAMTVLTSTLSTNTATGGIGYGNGSGSANGGAIYNRSNNTYTISASTFNGNVAQGGASGGYGGGSAEGGALFSDNNNAPFLVNSTLYRNRAIGGTGGTTRPGGNAAGGGIYQFAGGDNLTVLNSTIIENGAVGGSGSATGTKSGSGIFGGLSGSGVTISNTIISGNALAENCGGIIVGGGYNLEYLSTTCGLSAAKNDQSGDHKLVALADNGGQTQTMALRAGSAAIDTGDDSACAAARVNKLDQRGFTRPFGTRCDIGAYEFIAPTLATAFSPPIIGSGGTTVLTLTLANPSGVAVTGVGFTATLPSQLSLKNTPSGTCGGTINVAANVITVGGISMAVAASCAITATVAATTAGTFFTTTGPLASTQFGAVGVDSTATLTVNGPAASVVEAGSGQTAQVNTSFATPLQAKVTDSIGNPIVGASVTFFAPGGGASCIFAGGGSSYNTTTDADGVATALQCTANATVGSYTVQANTPGVAIPASFSLTNSLTAPTVTPAPAPTPVPGPGQRSVYLPLTTH